MRVYDFDDTIYKGDSGVDFFKYSFSKRPFKVLLSLLNTILFLPLYALKIIKTIELKEKIFGYVKSCNNIQELVEDFWDLNEHKIKPWYLKEQHKDDVIISASFDFYIEPICKRLNIKNVITTEYNLKTGKTIGLHCSGENKIVKFEEKFPGKKMSKSYSDSGSDIPILEYAKEGFIVIDDQIIPYDKNYKFKNKTIKYLRDYDFLNILVNSLTGLVSLVIFTLVLNIFLDFIFSFSIAYFLSSIITCLLAIKYLFKNSLLLSVFSLLIYYVANYAILILIYVTGYQFIKYTLPLLSLIYFIISYFSLYFINKERGI